MFYAADNHYGSDTSTGFANTWYVLAFADKNSRNEYVDHRPNLSARAIKRPHIGKFLPKRPRPFTGERYAITRPLWLADDALLLPEGFVGYVDVSTPDDPEFVEPLNK
jgi:hypothetical protein